MAKNYKLSDSNLPASTAVVSLLIGDDTALGYGSESAQVSLWPDAQVTLTYGKIWDKWMLGTRDTADDTGTGFTAVNRSQGDAASDVGLEYLIGLHMERRFVGSAITGETPDCCIIKYATSSAVVSAEGTTAKSFHPQAGAASAHEILIAGYLAPALTYLRANYDEVVIDQVYLSMGLADAITGGSGESFAANMKSLISSITATLGQTHSTLTILAPLCDRVVYPNLALVRDIGEYLSIKVADSDLFDRGGKGAGATPLNSVLSGEGIVSLGNFIASTGTTQLRSIL